MGGGGGTPTIKSTVVLSWRESESFHKAQQLYPYVTNILVPDIAFQLGPYHLEDFRSLPPEKQVDFLFLLRRDHESTLLPGLLAELEDTNDDDEADTLERQNVTQILHDAVVAAMQGSATGNPYSYRIVDWPDRLHLFHSDDPYFSKTSIELLSMGHVVICDRLHAAVLAFLSGIPFVYLDQVTGKLSNSLGVAFDTWEGCGTREFQNTTIEVLRYSRAANLTEAIEIGAHLRRLSF